MLGIFNFIGKIAKPVADTVKVIVGGRTTQEIEAQVKLTEAQSKITDAISSVNVENAKDSSWFIRGWRPACGWLLVFMLLITAINALFFNVLYLNPLWYEILNTLLLGMFGIRGFEKVANYFVDSKYNSKQGEKPE